VREIYRRVGERAEFGTRRNKHKPLSFVATGNTMRLGEVTMTGMSPEVAEILEKAVAQHKRKPGYWKDRV
jgi:hypothetical protein